jgi:hypothetical protein
LLTRRQKNKQRYNPQNPCPPILTTHEAEYNTIGYILDNDVFLTAAEKVSLTSLISNSSTLFFDSITLLSIKTTNSSQKQTVKRFYLNHAPWVIYKILDKTVATEYSLYLEEEKDEKRTQHQREKRRAKKKAMQKQKGTELERQGVLEVGGKDKRMGGKSYKKGEDGDVDAGAGAAEEKKEVKVGLEGSVIEQVKQMNTQKIANGDDKRVVKEEAKRKEEKQRKEEVKKKAVWDTPWKKDSAVDEIRKPNWFFSGEDVLKEG